MGEFKVLEVKGTFYVAEILDSAKTKEEAKKKKREHMKKAKENEFEQALDEARIKCRSRYF